jgi:23S rRNA (pseudouridine1915-N3)-methyltransferase
MPKSAILLDPNGRLYKSEQFSEFLFQKIEEGGSRVAFVIGGPEGLPQTITKSGYSLLSLSPMTFTHQMTRLLLLEQIYRGVQIREGRPYHK